MAYKTHTFNDKDVLTHDDMNNIISGINEVKSDINKKQATLVSGNNIKTINGVSLLGSGNIVISGDSGSTPSSTDNYTLYNQAKSVVSRFHHREILNIEPAKDKEVDLILFTGQSNSCGRAQLGDCKNPEDLILSVPMYKAFHFNNTSSTEPVQIVEPITANGTSTYGYIPAFLNAYYKTTHRQVCACFYSVGGSNLNKFTKYKLDSNSEPTTTKNTAYTTTVQRVDYAKQKLSDLGYTIKGIYVVWCQGENDAYYYGYENNYATLKEQSLTTPELKTAYYKELFSKLVEDWKTDMGIDQVFIISIGHRKESPTKWEMYGPIVQAHKELGKESDDCTLVTTLFTGAEKFIEEDGTIRNIMRDNTHYVPEGYVRAGLDAGVNAGIFVNSGNKMKPIIIDYEKMLFDDGVSHERPFDKFVYDPYRIDMNLFKQYASDMVTSISLNFNTATMGVGETITLIPTLYPSTVTNKEVIFKSNNESIVTVDTNGVITAKSVGTTTITVTPEASSVVIGTATITVLAEKIAVESITLNYTTASMLVGNTLQLEATVLPDNATDKTITWSSSDSGAASVTQTGLVTALEQGDATIIATPNGNPNLSATCVIQLAHKVTNWEEILSFNFAEKTLNDYVNDDVITIPETSTVDSLQYSEKGLTTTSSTSLVNGVKLVNPINVNQDWAAEITMTMDPWVESTGVTEALYPNMVFLSSIEHDDTHGSNCLAPAIYINSGGFGGRLGDNLGTTVNQKNVFVADGVEHTYRWEYDSTTYKSKVYKDGEKLGELSWSSTTSFPGGQFGYILGVHNGYSSAKNFNIKIGYYIKSVKFYKN